MMKEWTDLNDTDQFMGKVKILKRYVGMDL